MTIYAKNAGTWKTMQRMYAKAGGVWSLVKGVWVKASGVWKFQGGVLVSVAVGGDLGPVCGFNGPPLGMQGTCTAATTLTAVVSGGWLPLTYQWQELVDGAWTNLGTAQTQNVSKVVGTTGRTHYYRVTVTDATGAVATSPSTAVFFVGENVNQ